jgi:AraC-type DNA-binding domain-containing proteins
MLHKHYEGRAFAPHWHEEFAIGLIDAGVEKFAYRGADHHASVGEIVLLNAGEVHTGEAVDERGFSFQMLYVAEDLLREAAGQSHGLATLHFRDAVVASHPAVLDLSRAHRAYEASATTLETESLLLTALRKVIEFSGNWQSQIPELPCTLGVARTRDYLEAHIAEDVSLEELVALSGLSKFHLIRSFKTKLGLSPHAYQTQHRVFLAKQLLRTLPATEVAQRCGFFDQSHLNRAFRMLVGTTPGMYAQQIRS